MLNNEGMMLYIKKRPFFGWLTHYIFILPFLLSFLLDFLHLPSVIKYTADLAWVIVFLCLFVHKKLTIHKRLLPFLLFAGLFVVYTAVIYVFNYQSIFYYLWGLRNNFRFYAAFLAFAVLFDKDDAESALKLIDILFWINAVVVFVQFFVMGYKQDYLGGIFGVSRGCNSYSIVLLSIVCSRSALLFMSGKEKTWSCFLKCGLATVISAMSEIKFFFVIFVLIFAVSAIFTKFSWQKVVSITLMALLLMFSSSVITALFGESNSINFERIIQLITSDSYATSEDLGRLTAIPTISRTILTDFWQRLFGMGLGNCDTSSFAICNTPFFEQHQDLHYTWFSSAFLYLETGYCGLLINLCFYGMCFAFTLKRLKRGEGVVLFNQMAIIMSMICVLLTFYNSSLRTETGYIAYFVLALSLIGDKEQAIIRS